jgi:hypothetical protein
VRRAAVAALATLAAGCGGGQSPEAGARATVQRYLSALGRGDAAAACREFTDTSRQKLAEFGERRLRLKPGSCAKTIGVALRGPGGPQLRRLGRAKIARVVVKGDSAEVSIAGVGQRTKVVKADGAWRIESEPTGETD